MDPRLEEFNERFTALIGVIDNALAAIEGGTMPDLGTLDSDVAALCREVEKADAALAQGVQPLMAEMIGKLDQLAQGLMEYQQKTEGL